MVAGGRSIGCDGPVKRPRAAPLDLVERQPIAWCQVREPARHLDSAPAGAKPGGVTASGVVYAIGSGSSSKKLELALIGSDGKRYTLRTTVGNNYHPKFGTG